MKCQGRRDRDVEEALPAKLALFVDLPASGVGEGEVGRGGCRWGIGFLTFRSGSDPGCTR